MKTTNHDIEEKIVVLLANSIELFLWTEKWLSNNRRWFTGSEIAEGIGKPDPMHFLYALCRLRFDRIEIDDDRLRHV